MTCTPSAEPNLASIAQSFIGTPFRLHGRDPQQGLDCVGVLYAVLKAEGSLPLHALSHLPNGYSLRTLTSQHAQQNFLTTIAEKLGLSVVCDGPLAHGDILILQPVSCLMHIAIVSDDHNIIHAHAGLRKVVLSRLPSTWPILGHWRLRLRS